MVFSQWSRKMIVGYLRVSKVNQDLEHQRNSILLFANKEKMVVDNFVEMEISSQKNLNQRKLDTLIAGLGNNDTLIVSELSRLGRSVTEVVSITNEVIEKGIRFVSIKENIDLKDRHSLQSKVMITMFGLFAELERDLISQRTKEALATKRANGVRLGRPKGPGKSKLDPYKKQIQQFLDKDVSMLSIAKILGVSYPTLFRFIKQRRMLKKSQRIPQN